MFAQLESAKTKLTQPTWNESGRGKMVLKNKEIRSSKTNKMMLKSIIQPTSIINKVMHRPHLSTIIHQPQRQATLQIRKAEKAD